MSKQKPEIELARVYNLPSLEGSFRVLVDRLWPRGMRKADLQLDAWMKELAPSNELRRWFNHDPQRWDEFRKKYFKELEARSGKLSELFEAAGDRPILMLYGARDEQHNHAVALRQWIEKQSQDRNRQRTTSNLQEK